MSSILIQGEMIRLAAITAVTSPIDHGNHNAARYHLKASFDVYGIAGTGGRRFIFDGIEDARQEHKRLLQALGWFNEFLETTTDPAYIPVMPSKLKPAASPATDIHEVGRDDLKRRAKKMLIDKGVKKNDRFPAFGVVDLMVELAVDAVTNPPDRCAWPECGCCHDASCNEAPTASPSPAPAVVPLDRDGHSRTCAYMPERPCSCVIGSPCPNLHVRSTVIQDRARSSYNFDRD